MTDKSELRQLLREIQEHLSRQMPEAGTVSDVFIDRIDEALAPTTQGTDSDAFVCANCKGLFGDLADGREPEELCETCYNHSQEPEQPDTDGLADEASGLFARFDGHMDADELELSERILAALRTDRKAVLEEEQRNLLVKCVRGDPVHHDDRMALLRTLHELESPQ